MLGWANAFQLPCRQNGTAATCLLGKVLSDTSLNFATYLLGKVLSDTSLNFGAQLSAKRTGFG